MPLLLEFLVPGFIFMTMFNYFTSSKIEHSILWSVAISYILKALCSFLHEFIFKDVIFKWNERVIILVLISIILAIILIRFYESEWLHKIFKFINFKTQHDCIWNDVIDMKRGTTLKVICNDTTYIGILYMFEEHGKDSWFVLSDCIIQENEESYDSSKSNFPCKIVINLNDVKRIELYYGNTE